MWLPIRKRKRLVRYLVIVSRKQRRSDYNEILEWETRFNLGLNTVKNYQLYQKLLQIKVVEN